jgi:hypothetical protein
MTKPIKKTTKQEEKIVTSPQTANENEEHRIVYASDEEVMKALKETMRRHNRVLEALAK